MLKSDCHSTDIHLCDEITNWSNKAFKVYDYYLWLSLIADFIILFASLIVLTRVYFIFKRRDWFLILTPGFFFLKGLLYVPYDLLTIKHFKAEIIGTIRDYLSVFGFFFYLMGHWTFSAQYL